ncbi:MAG: hypothetical protein ACK5T0_06885 [Vampirovibrionales bacterium]
MMQLNSYRSNLAPPQALKANRPQAQPPKADSLRNGHVSEDFGKRTSDLNQQLDEIAQLINGLPEKEAKKLLEDKMGPLFAEIYSHGKSNQMYGSKTVLNMLEEFVEKLFRKR